jgi:hypothetical protein
VAITPPCKSARRSCAKVVAQLDGDWRRLTDVVRATIVYPSVGELLRALRHLTMDFTGLDVLHVRNDFDARRGNLPWRGCCCVHVMLSGDDDLHVCELRLMLQPLSAV